MSVAFTTVGFGPSQPAAIQGKATSSNSKAASLALVDNRDVLTMTLSASSRCHSYDKRAAESQRNHENIPLLTLQTKPITVHLCRQALPVISLGSKASRRPSPMKFRHSSVAARQVHGKTSNHQ